MSLSDMVSIWRIFCVFAKIGAFTIGGGYAMIPIIRDELVKRGWLTDEELPDIIALAQSVTRNPSHCRSSFSHLVRYS